MALPQIAHEADAPAFERCAKTALADHVLRLALHLGEQGVHRGDVETREALVEAADDLVADRRAQEADGAADAGAGGNQHAIDADLFGDARRVNRATAAEGDHHPVLIGLAGLDRVDPRGVGHVLVHHLDDAEGCHLGIEAERGTERGRDRAPRRIGIEVQRAAGEALRIVAAKQQIGVRHGGPGAAAAVAGRAGIGAGALRPDRDPPERVDMRERAAAGADLHHLDHRDAQRQAGPLLEAPDAGDLEAARGLRREAVDQADLRRGAAHVEGDHAFEPALARDAGGEQRPAGRAEQRT